MKTEKIRNLVPKHINKKAFIHTPEYLPKLHGLFVIAGSRGSGKTHSCTNLIRFYKKEGLCDRVLIISPTGISNKIFYSDIINDEEDIITSTESQSIGRVIEIVEQEAEDFRVYEHIKNLYTTWQKLQRKKSFDVNKIDPELLLEFDQYQIWDMEEPPKWKYENDSRAPIIHVLLDDVQGSQIMKGSGPLINLCIKHRHIGGIGLSLYLLVQSYISVSSCPRPVRENSQCIILFRVRDKKLEEQIADEATPIQFTRDQFLEAYRYATKDNVHDFLMVDYNAKDNRILRKNFDTFISFE